MKKGISSPKTTASPSKTVKFAGDGPGHISKDKMKSMLKSEYSPEKLEKQLQNCCTEHEKCSQDLKKLATGIEELYKMRPAQYADRVSEMEMALEDKCHEIKKSRELISQLLSQAACETRDQNTQSVVST